MAAASVAGTLALTLNPAQTDAAPLEFPAASPLGSVKQRVGVTDIEVTYSRPSMRGRKVFGGLEPYGDVWRTGANGATTISFSTDVKFGGSDVAAGTYAVLSIPGEKEWTVILSTATDQFGAYAYDAKNDVVRVNAAPVALAAPVETLTMQIGHLTSSSAHLQIAWENTSVSVPVETDVVATMVPRIEAAMAGDGPHPYGSAAMFYFDNDLDMTKAAAWMDKALEENPEAFWMIYRKGLILEKAGDMKGAVAAATQSMELAMKRSGALKAEYVRLNEALIARCKK